MRDHAGAGVVRQRRAPDAGHDEPPVELGYVELRVARRRGPVPLDERVAVGQLDEDEMTRGLRGLLVGLGLLAGSLQPCQEALRPSPCALVLVPQARDLLVASTYVGDEPLDLGQLLLVEPAQPREAPADTYGVTMLKSGSPFSSTLSSRSRTAVSPAMSMPGLEVSPARSLSIRALVTVTVRWFS